MSTNESGQPPTRRGFLDWLIGLFSAITGVAVALPGAAYLWPAAKGGGAQNVEIEGADNLTLGQAVTVQVAGKAVIVVRRRDGFKAFSASCTHLGCLVHWESARQEFLCPCHAAVFDKDGGVVSGPPPSPLPVYDVKEVGDKVYVTAA